MRGQGVVHDVVAIGGAPVGGSTAWHLLNREPDLKVAVIEKDPTYEFAASTRANAMVSLVFSPPENLPMSRYGQEFYSDLPKRVRIADERPVLDYRRGGLPVVGNDAHQAEDIAVNAALQQALGCNVDVLTAREVASRWPALNAGGIVHAVHSADTGGEVDPHGALTGLCRRARDLGADYIHGKVSGFDVSGGHIRSVILEDAPCAGCGWWT